jgi:hypothetical protein
VHDFKLNDKAAVGVLVLLASLLANVLLLTQLFVWRPEYTAELRGIRERLTSIEARLNGAIPAQPDASP